MIFSVNQWGWIKRNLDIIFLIPIIVLALLFIFGVFSLYIVYPYLSVTIQIFIFLSGSFFLENAIQYRKHRKLRIFMCLFLFIAFVYLSENFPAFRGSLI